MSDRIEAAVLAAIRAFADVPPEAITHTMLLQDDLGIDSLEFVEMIQLIEQTLGIHISDESVAPARDVGALLDAVRTSAGAD